MLNRIACRLPKTFPATGSFHHFFQLLDGSGDFWVARLIGTQMACKGKQKGTPVKGGAKKGFVLTRLRGLEVPCFPGQIALFRAGQQSLSDTVLLPEAFTDFSKGERAHGDDLAKFGTWVSYDSAAPPSSLKV